MLCPDCHRGTNGVHGKNGHILDLKLKLKVQNIYSMTDFSEDDIRKLMGGRLYIE